MGKVLDACKSGAVVSFKPHFGFQRKAYIVYAPARQADWLPQGAISIRTAATFYSIYNTENGGILLQPIEIYVDDEYECGEWAIEYDSFDECMNDRENIPMFGGSDDVWKIKS